MMKTARVWVVLTLVGTLFGGCCGGGTKVQSTTNNTTTGQQLIDLKKAHDEGAINEEQYNKMKKEIVDKAGGK